MSFKGDLESLLHIHSAENLTNTPDFILADYINSCLYIFETATLARDKFLDARNIGSGMQLTHKS